MEMLEKGNPTQGKPTLFPSAAFLRSPCQNTLKGCDQCFGGHGLPGQGVQADGSLAQAFMQDGLFLWGVAEDCGQYFGVPVEQHSGLEEGTCAAANHVQADDFEVFICGDYFVG